MLSQAELQAALAAATNDTDKSVLLLQQARGELASAMGYAASKGQDTTAASGLLARLSAWISALIGGGGAPPLPGPDQVTLLGEIQAVDASAASAAAINSLSLAVTGALTVAGY